MKKHKINSTNKEYFNKWEFEQIFTISKKNPHLAKIKYEEYLQKILEIIQHFHIIHQF